ncbi:hypothetical protein BDN72DRAFT_851290, partial [Pluteus cervinus]
MARTHERSTSPDLPDPSTGAVKRQKISHGPFNGTNDSLGGSPTVPSSSSSRTTHTNGNGVANGKAKAKGHRASSRSRSRVGISTGGSTVEEDDPTKEFAPDLFDHNHIARLQSSYVSNQPFKYAVVEKLFNDDLLKSVKDECLSELSFSEKETDIYKVNQTGDLASLNYLTSSQISLLPNLLALRDALYSKTFRSFLQAVTGCGPLSGKKQDMSVNSYTKGCHLLNHDDVIGTRRVSYILYMPLPHYQLWSKDWGGALELYPVQPGEDGQNEPEAMPTKSIPPSWNQFILFEVQPGKSFHSVEEVVAGGEMEDGRQRLSISGWFHSAQEGEEGYTPEPPAQENVKSSREQLTSTSTVFKSYPDADSPVPLEAELSEEHVAFLSEFLNPVYLQQRTMAALAERFADESSLELHSFLSSALAESLEPRLRELDTKDGLGAERAGRIPPHTSGTVGGVWTVKGPPHKWRYCVLKPHEANGPAEAVSPRAHASSDEILRSLQDELFPSEAFRAWTARVTTLFPLKHSVEARRFRPGMDYTLATSDDREARLDVVLGLTPEVRAAGVKRIQQVPMTSGWQPEWGGWECYMAPHNEEDDPAVYRSGTQKKSKATNGTHPPPKPSENAVASSSKSIELPQNSVNGVDSLQIDEDANLPAGGGDAITVDDELDAELMDADADGEAVAEDDEESTLLTVQPGFNRLLLVLRDERVMRFVKYVSAFAEGSRWDVCGEYEVGMLQEEEVIDVEDDG